MEKKSIAIIGATENTGIAIIKKLAIRNYRLLLFSHDSEKLQLLEKEITKNTPAADIFYLSCMVDAGWEADIIISALPYGFENQVAEKIRDVATQKIVISITNSFNNSLKSIESVVNNGAEELQKLLPLSKVLKAFNNTMGIDFAPALAFGNEQATFLGNNDKEAVETLRKIISTIGFDPDFPGPYATKSALLNSQPQTITGID